MAADEKEAIEAIRQTLNTDLFIWLHPDENPRHDENYPGGVSLTGSLKTGHLNPVRNYR